MLRRLSTTPCPVGDLETLQKRRASTLDLNEETTANLDFTTEFKASFRDVRPRRPPKIKKPAMDVTIHEDEELRVNRPQDIDNIDNIEPSMAELPQQAHNSNARMMKDRRVSFRSFINEDGQRIDPKAFPSLSRAPRRSSIKPEQSTTCDHIPAESPKIAKPARRGTIFIPSDDTTMPTMFMDIFSPLKRPDAGDQSSSAIDPNLTGLAFQMAQKRARRTSTLATSPKRIPLGSSHAQIQNSTIVHDRAGRGPGKENMPPGHVRNKEKMEGLREHSVRRSISSASQSLGAGPRPSRLLEPTASSAARKQQHIPKQQVKAKTSWNSNFLLPKPRNIKSGTGDVEDGAVVLESNQDRRITRSPVPSRFVIPKINAAAEHQYAFVPEGIEDASMYEQNWLGQQEIAITQLINNLFDAASLNTQHHVTADLDRLRLLQVYGNAEMSMLYKRIQAGLLHGPLSLSGEGFTRSRQLYEDLSKRQAYTQFWLTTYEPRVLQFALEVVVGRVVPLQASSGALQSSTADNTRPLQRFLEKFLIRNEDSVSDRRSPAEEDALYQRTILRSLMLIKLLDLMKTDGTMHFAGRIFQIAAEVKSSSHAAVLIFRMLNPSAGDATRSLKNLGYIVSHEQYPLEEYNYKVKNLAVDIREGVRLTRLVELLLYCGVSKSLGYGQDLDATATIITASGATICTAEGNQDWPLSQYLKVPCDSRAAKLYNVNIALAALGEVRGMSAHLHDLSAGDIVDGFREKTVHLLWALCSKYGLGGLVDWEDLKREVKRLGRTRGKIGSVYLASFEVDEDDDGYMHFKALLRMWVRAVAMSRGLRVRNFTTDFADGRLFDAIVSEYQPYLAGCMNHSASGDLDDRLRRLGCSNEFARLFATRPGVCVSRQIFDRDFVLASLAFLASRLLQPSKATRAAVVLQKAWRKRSERVLSQRKKVLHAMAIACAEHVRSVEAKTLIWRAWCKYRARKTRQLVASPGGVFEHDIWLSL